MKKLLLASFFSLIAIFAMGQTITGTIIDGDTKEPLIGAAVLISGTTTGTIADVDGNFSLENPDGGEVVLEFSFLGYGTTRMKAAGSQDVGTVALYLDSQNLSEVTVTGTMDIVRDRRTPVAVTTISTADIQAKAGNVEFPELMKSTPSIYVAGQAGGYGDSEVFTRGFDQSNTAFLLNGQPINGMEDGKMYWSNWSGMTDVANAVQIQRGLGSSKLAISSVGGTINIIMKPTELRRGGSATFLYGNDSYLKGTVSYNTGMMNDKFGVSFLLTHWQGDGWAEGTKGQGQNYFISAGFQPNESHQFNFLITGAPQWHDQNFNSRISDHFDAGGDFNIKHNGNWGTLNGEYYTTRRNYYHKPVANLNWEWTLSDKSALSTVLYASWGRGGGSGGIGDSSNRFFTDDGQWDYDAIVAANQADNGSEAYVMRNSVNNHQWYGMVTNYKNRLSQNLNLSVGMDLRSYTGSHFREVRDLLGAPYYTQSANARFGERQITAEFEANPWKAISSYATDLEDRIAYNNDETIQYGGLFGQLEYSAEKFSVYGQAAISQQSYVRIELFNQTEENEKSDKVVETGYNVKGGFSYLIDNNHSVFVNTGYYKRQPFLDDIFLNFSNFINPATQGEKIFGMELGYKYQSKNFAANLNLYRTSWKDRSTTNVIEEGQALPNGMVVDEDHYRNTLQDQLHMGVEFDFSYRVNDDLKLKGYTSVGDWAFDGVISSKYYDEDRNLVDESAGDDVDGVKVGGAAQTTFGLGADYKVTNDLKFDVDYNYYSNLYSNIGVGLTSLELPSFGLLDIGITYNLTLSNGNLMTFRANLYNALGKEYISRATSAIEASANEDENWNGINRSNFVTFGKTQTWNISARYSF